MGEVPIRFRHTAFDLGPFSFPYSTTILQLKDKALADWPKEGAPTAVPPKTAAEITLILSGKIAEDQKTLNDYKRDIGELTPETLVTFHLLVRPNPAAKPPGAAPKPEEPQGCKCCIS